MRGRDHGNGGEAKQNMKHTFFELTKLSLHVYHRVPRRRRMLRIITTVIGTGTGAVAATTRYC
jgi:hypothetical protein